MIDKNEVIKLWSDTAIKRLYAETSDISYKDTVFSTTEIRVLKYICMNPGITSVDLAKSSGRTRGTISIIMKKFSSLGLAEFSDDPSHRKRKLIFATDAGQHLCEERNKSDRDYMSGLMGMLEEKYSRKEMQIITDALYTILASDYSYVYK